ncbi:MAG: site-specific integrase, partial [Chloroflexi bacterium]|nr:site-specific integrase [Chloroflexota bacterium]
MAKRRTKKEGSIWKDKKKWRAAVLVDGKRITRNFDTKAECSAWIKETQSQIDRGMTYRKSNITLGIFIQQWLDVHKTKLAPKTAPRYEQLVRDYILPQLGNIKLRELRLDKIEAHYITLLEQGLSPRSVRFVHSILHKCLNDAIRRGYIGFNAAHGAILPRYEPKEISILDEDEVLRFLITIRGNANEALYILAIKTGMRKGELLALKWSDLDWKKGTIRVQRQVQRIKGQGIVFRPPKTRAGRRTIQLGEQMLHTLRNHRERLKTRAEVAGNRWQHYDLVFPSTVGTPIGGSNIIKV